MITILKTTLFLGFFFISIFNIFCQSQCFSKTEIKTNQNTYIVEETNMLFICYNRNNKLFLSYFLYIYKRISMITNPALNSINAGFYFFIQSIF